ncbi:MAG: efflux RND transporter periplasmic adaptor subunit [Planctomycetia bacterium]|nr:efflux RND transporter periplasmic adaptor subunit [Planctomycetia bacterium]
MAMRRTTTSCLGSAPWSPAVILVATCGLATVGLTMVGCQRPAAPPAPPPVPEVVVTTPRTARVPEYLEVTGRIDAEFVVDVRSRVTGYLTEVAFRDGQFVDKGDPLYGIDQRPYAAQLAAAAGTVERLLGERRFLEVQVERFGKLVEKGAASRQELDSYKAKLEENAGSLAAARAQHEAAQLNLEFCSIAAPITGQISRTLLQIGNLVTQDVTSLATIVSIDPVFVYFNVDEPTFVRMTARARAAGAVPAMQAGGLVVDVGLVDDVARTYPHRSRVDFLNNQIDTKTATITMRGRLDNPYSRDPAAARPPLFRPGMFARVRLPLGDAVERRFVPEAAIGNNQDRKILWVVGPDDVATAREVTVGQKLGTWVAVAATDAARPLGADERIVVRGLQRCREGKPVRPTGADAGLPELSGFTLPGPGPSVEEPVPAASAPGATPPEDGVRGAAPEALPAAEKLPDPVEAPR